MAKEKLGVTYPFQTKAQIKAELAGSFGARCAAMVTLYRLQTDDEQETKTTKYSNRRGFMSSHAVNGTRVAEKILAGEELSDKDVEHVDAIAPRYAKQLATLRREQAIRSDPALNAVAAVFGVAAD